MKRIEKPPSVRSKNETASQEVLDQERAMQERMRNLLEGLQGGSRSDSTPDRVGATASSEAPKKTMTTTTATAIETTVIAGERGASRTSVQHSSVVRPAPQRLRQTSPPPLFDQSNVSTARSSSASQSSSASRRVSPTAVFVSQRGEQVTFRPVTATSSTSSNSVQRTSTSSGASRSSPSAPVAVSQTTSAARDAIAELFASNSTNTKTNAVRSPSPLSAAPPTAPRIREPQRSADTRPPLRETASSAAPPTSTSRPPPPPAAPARPPQNPHMREKQKAAASNDADEEKLTRELDVAGQLLETFERKDEDLRRLQTKLHRVEVHNESLRGQLAETHESKRGLLREYRRLLRRVEKHNAKKARSKNRTREDTQRRGDSTSSQEDGAEKPMDDGGDDYDEIAGWRGTEPRLLRVAALDSGIIGLIGRMPLNRTSRRQLKVKKKRRSHERRRATHSDEGSEEAQAHTKQPTLDAAPPTTALLDVSAVQRGAAIERLTLELRYLQDELKARDACVALQTNAMLEQQQQIDRMQTDLRTAMDTITAREKDVLAMRSKLEHEERVLTDWKAWEREHSAAEAKARALEAEKAERTAEHLHALEDEVRDARVREAALLRRLECQREAAAAAQASETALNEPHRTPIEPSSVPTAGTINTTHQQQQQEPHPHSEMQLTDGRAALEKRRRKHAEATLRSATDRVRELTSAVDRLASQLEEKDAALRAAVERATREREKMEDRLRSMDTEWTAKYRATKDLAQKWIDAYGVLQRESEQHTQRCEAELDSLRAEWMAQREADKKEAEKRYTHEVSEHKSQSEKLSERLRREEDRVATWRRRCAEQTAALEDERERQLSLSSEAATFQSHCDDLEKHVAQHAKEVRQLRDELQQQQDLASEERQKWETELQASREEQLEQQRMASNAAQLHSKQIDSLRAQLEAANERIRDAEKLREKNATDNDRVVRAMRSAANDVKRAEEEVHRHQDRVASLESEVKELRSRCSQKDTEKHTLAEALATAKANVTQSEAALKKITDANRELQRSLADQKAIANDYRSLKQTTLPTLRAEVEEWQRKHTLLGAHLESKSTSLRHLQAELRSRDAKITTLDSEKEALASQVADLMRQIATARTVRRIDGTCSNENASTCQPRISSSSTSTSNTVSFATDTAALSERYERNFDKLLAAYDGEVQRAILHAFDDGLAVYERAAHRFVSRLSSDLAELVCQMVSESEQCTQLCANADSNSNGSVGAYPPPLQHSNTVNRSSLPPRAHSENGLNQSACTDVYGRDDGVLSSAVEAECQAIAASLGFSGLEELCRAASGGAESQEPNQIHPVHPTRTHRAAEGLLSIVQSGHFQSFLSAALLAQLSEELDVDLRHSEMRKQRSETPKHRNDRNRSKNGPEPNSSNPKNPRNRLGQKHEKEIMPRGNDSPQTTTDVLRHMFRALRA